MNLPLSKRVLVQQCLQQVCTKTLAIEGKHNANFVKEKNMFGSKDKGKGKAKANSKSRSRSRSSSSKGRAKSPSPSRLKDGKEYKPSSSSKERAKSPSPSRGRSSSSRSSEENLKYETKSRITRDDVLNKKGSKPSQKARDKIRETTPPERVVQKLRAKSDNAKEDFTNSIPPGEHGDAGHIVPKSAAGSGDNPSNLYLQNRDENRGRKGRRDHVNFERRAKDAAVRDGSADIIHKEYKKDKHGRSRSRRR